MNEEQKQSTQPLYEFAAEDAYTSPGEPSESSAGEREGSEGSKQPSAHLPSDEEIRRGLIYPPPPSFYQNMQIVPVPPFASSEDRERYGEAAPEQRPYSSAPPQIPSPPETLPQAKRSRTWIWIVVAVLGVALLASCGLCGWGMYTIFSSTFEQVAAPLTVTQDYYSALQAKNYTLAYSYLSPQGTISGLTLDEYVQQARARDTQYGPLRSYTLEQPSFTDTSTGSMDLSHATITVNVSRAQQNYSVLLTLQKVGGHWKIVDFDRL